MNQQDSKAAAQQDSKTAEPNDPARRNARSDPPPAGMRARLAFRVLPRSWLHFFLNFIDLIASRIPPGRVIWSCCLAVLLCCCIAVLLVQSTESLTKSEANPNPEINRNWGPNEVKNRWNINRKSLKMRSREQKFPQRLPKEPRLATELQKPRSTYSFFMKIDDFWAPQGAPKSIKNQ